MANGAPSPRTDILGKGWSFPFEFNESTGGVATASDVQLVGMSLRQIMETKLGTRFFNRGFGSRLRDIVFEPIDPQLVALIEHYIRDSIERWEKRVVLNVITVDIQRYQRGLIDMGVDFTIIKTQQRGNLVFPFYLSAAQRAELLTG